VIDDPQSWQPSRAPHPVAFDVAYPDRHSRWLIFVKWLLVIPQAFIAYLLGYLTFLLAIFAWFAILFTGRYPRSMFEFAVGCMRWSGNVFAYFALLRDEYPPFSFSQGEYAVTFEVPYPDRQSRWRLFIRLFAIVPNYIVLQFVLIAWLLTSFISWFAILVAGHYPRGLFYFSVGVMRWYQRAGAYLYLLRDEYPPYSVSADARPGNEAVSAVLGAPIFGAIAVVYVGIVVLPFIQGSETVVVDSTLLGDRAAFARARPSLDTSNIRITLEGLTPQRRCPSEPGECFGIQVLFEKHGSLPALYVPYFFKAKYCVSSDEVSFAESPQAHVEGDRFHLFWSDGAARSTVYFQYSPDAVCELEYFAGAGTMRFRFE
jgi:hypothetical protein